VSNDTPPRAVLADFGFITVIFDPDRVISHSGQIEGGTKRFMSPELLVPEECDKKGAVPTPQADIYAFGLVIFQVFCASGIAGVGRFYVHFLQVLTGEVPFRGVGDSAIGHHVLRGKRPDKPENAAAIGFSDSLWDFSKLCWHGDMNLRPVAKEVVTHLREVVDNWNGLMPPHVQAVDLDGNDTSNSEGGSDSNEPSEFETSILPPRYSSSNGTDPWVESPSIEVPGTSPTESQTPSGLFSGPATPPPQELSQDEPGEVATRPSEEPQSGPLAPTEPQPEGPHDDLHGAETTPDLDSHDDPPPSQLPQTRKPTTQKFLDLLGLNR